MVCGYIAGILGILWFLVWIFLAYSTPATHPRISRKEREYIQSSIGESAKNVGYTIAYLFMNISYSALYPRQQPWLKVIIHSLWFDNPLLCIATSRPIR